MRFQTRTTSLQVPNFAEFPCAAQIKSLSAKSRLEMESQRAPKSRNAVCSTPREIEEGGLGPKEDLFPPHFRNCPLPKSEGTACSPPKFVLGHICCSPKLPFRNATCVYLLSQSQIPGGFQDFLPAMPLESGKVASVATCPIIGCGEK